MHDDAALAVHEIRQVGPVQDEVFVVQFVFQNIADPGHLQRHVRLGADGQPHIGFGRVRRQARIDDDRLHPLLPQLVDHAAAGCRAGIGRIRAPEHQGLDRAVFFVKKFEAVRVGYTGVSAAVHHGRRKHTRQITLRAARLEPVGRAEDMCKPAG